MISGYLAQLGHRVQQDRIHEAMAHHLTICVTTSTQPDSSSPFDSPSSHPDPSPLNQLDFSPSLDLQEINGAASDSMPQSG